MKKITNFLKKTMFLVVLLLFNFAFSQNDNEKVQDSIKGGKLEEVVVTGVINPKSRLESSVSVSSIGIKQIEQSAPRTSGEVFRNIPGVRAESSGGEGNANFNVRGVPVSAGGSRYLQLQEDGLPLMGNVSKLVMTLI